MRHFTQGLLSTFPLLMRRGKVVAWIGLTAAIGTGIGLLLRAQTGVATKQASAADYNDESQRREVALKLGSGESKQKKVQQRSEENDAEHIRRTSLRSIVPAGLPSP